MTQPNQTTPTALVLVKRGERIGSSRPDYVWWHELPADTTAEAARSLGYEVREFIPLSTLSRLVEELESRARTTLARYGVAASGHDRGRHQALREAASLISQSLPKGQSDDGND